MVSPELRSNLPHDLFEVGRGDDEVDRRFARGSVDALAVAEGFHEELNRVA